MATLEMWTCSSRSHCNLSSFHINLTSFHLFIYLVATFEMRTWSWDVVIMLISHFMVYVFVSIYAYAHVRIQTHACIAGSTPPPPAPLLSHPPTHPIPPPSLSLFLSLPCSLFYACILKSLLEKLTLVAEFWAPLKAGASIEAKQENMIGFTALNQAVCDSYLSNFV